MKKTTARYRALLATVRPRDLAGKTRRRMAAQEIADLEHLDAKHLAIADHEDMPADAPDLPPAETAINELAEEPAAGAGTGLRSRGPAPANARPRRETGLGTRLCGGTDS